MCADGDEVGLEYLRRHATFKCRPLDAVQDRARAVNALDIGIYETGGRDLLEALKVAFDLVRIPFIVGVEEDDELAPCK